jgi:MFS family permease
MNDDSNTGSKRPALPINVKLLGLASLLNDVASEMIFPLMPGFLIGVLGGTRFHLGIVEGVADSVSSLLRLFSGTWSDRLGKRKWLVVFGYMLAALARPIGGMATVPWHLLATRTADRIGKGIRTSPRDALIADSTEPSIRGRAFGFHQGMDHLGAAVGPVLATLFLLAWPQHLRTLFVLTLIPGLIVVGVLVFGLREKKATKPPEPIKDPLRPFHRDFWLYLLCMVVFTLSNSSDAFLLVRSGELGVQPALLPLMWCAFHVTKSAANFIAGRTADALGPRPLLIAGWLAYSAIYMAFAVATTTWQAWALFLLYGFAYSLTEPAGKAFVTRLTPADRRGTAFGCYNFSIGIAALPSSLIFGWLYERYGALIAFGWGAALAALSVGLLFFVRGERRPNS